MTDLESKLLSALNRFCFQNIWNEPLSELRANIVPKKISERSCTGTIFYRGTTHALPSSSEPFYLYAIPSQLMYVFMSRQVEDRWIDSTDLCNLYDILIHTYHLSGIMLSKKSVYFKKIGSDYLLAVSKKAASASGVVYNQTDDLRITMYFDSDMVNKITVRSDFVPTTDPSYIYRREMYDFIQTAEGDNRNLSVYINGKETEFVDMSTFPTGAYVDIIHDENILFEYNLDLTVLENNVGFFSDKDQTYKQLIHIPKSLNPDNKVLTHNTCEIHVRKKNSDGSVGQGLYLHRCATRSVDQVTHNDISIPLFILDAYRDYLGTQEISLRLVFRQHDKNNYLIRDKNYIDLLYTQDDATIIKHLLGKIRPTSLGFWKASHLESSMYIKMMFDVPNFITEDTMQEYVEGLGYYHTMALLCKKIVHTDILAWYDQTLTVSKPYLFMENAVYPVVYKNDRKILDQHIQYTNPSQLNLNFGVDPLVGIIPGDKLTVEMFVDGPKTVYSITPQSGASTIDIAYSDFVVLEEHDNSLLPLSLLDTISEKSYTEVTDYLGQIVVTPNESGVRLIFGPQMYGRTFIIQNRHRVYRFFKSIDTDLEDGNPIYLNCSYPVVDNGREVPIWYTPHTRVYLNGKYLVEGIDFTIKEIQDRLGRIGIKKIVIQNLEYLEPTNNFVEWIVTSAVEENKVSGYVVNLQAASPKELALLFENMTMVHVDGRYEQSAINKGNYIGLPENSGHRQGGIFEACTTVPEVINAFLSEYSPNEDLDRLKKLNDYFYGKQPVLPGMVVLPYSHKCFSPYVVTVIRDLLNGTLKGISLDPDEARMINQFATYENLKELDLVFSETYDLNYVDVFPHYKQITIPDTSVYRILQEFIRLVMPKDSVTSGEVYYDN